MLGKGLRRRLRSRAGVLCLASRPRRQGSGVPLSPIGSHRVPPGPTGSNWVPPDSPSQPLPQPSPRPPWGPGSGGFVGVTVTRGGRERVPHTHVGWLAHPQLPTAPHISGAGQGPAHPRGPWAPHGSGLRLGPDLPSPGSHPRPRGTGSPRTLRSPPLDQPFPGCSGPGSHSPLPGPVPGPRAGRGMSSSSVCRSKGLCAPRGRRHPAPPATAGTGTTPVPTLPAPRSLHPLPPRQPPFFQLPLPRPSSSIPWGSQPQTVASPPQKKPGNCFSRRPTYSVLCRRAEPMSPASVPVPKGSEPAQRGDLFTGEIFFSRCWTADPKEKLETSSLAFLLLPLLALIFIFLAAGGRKGAGKVMFFGKRGTAGERGIHRAGSLGKLRAGGPAGGREPDHRPPCRG